MPCLKTLAASTLAASLIAFLPHCATAQTWPNFQSGSFKVIGSATNRDPFCVIEATRYMAGRSALNLRIEIDTDYDEAVALILKNYDWTSLKAKEDYPLTVAIFKDGQLLHHYSPTAERNENYSLAMWLPGRFMDSFRQGTLLRVFKSNYEKPADDPEAEAELKLTLIAEIGLQGSSAAAANAMQCLQFVQRREQARTDRENAYNYISKNPF